MINSFLESMQNEISLTHKEISQYSPLVLAYVGDTIFEVFVRTMLVCEVNSSVHKLHKKSINFVKAKSQAEAIRKITEFLTPEEQDIVRRGRNAKSGTIPKNADITEYKYATGFESLMGYLFLRKEHDRLMQVIKMAIESGQDR